MRRMFAGSAGRGGTLAEERWLDPNAALPDHSFGVGTYGVPTVLWGKPTRRLSVGRYCSIAPDVTIMLGGNHRLGGVSTYPFGELTSTDDPVQHTLPMQECSKGNVTIGDDVWIGMGALILSGVSIGSGAVVAARSVVTRDVEPYAIVAGNPARRVRYRIAEHLIPLMLEVAWWEWPRETILAHRAALLSEDVEAFVERFGTRGP